MAQPDKIIEKTDNIAPLLRLMRERYSVRSFSDRSIEDEKLKLILTAGQIAPTAVNFQPQKIYVLQSAIRIGKIHIAI
ncbi:MAG: nitroreductase family protein, partial [Clostridia bacterium]|nr:nitroreductase family protein [Clostridia bacterium]